MADQPPRPWQRAWYTPRRVITNLLCLAAGFSIGSLIGAALSARK